VIEEDPLNFEWEAEESKGFLGASEWLFATGTFRKSCFEGCCGELTHVRLNGLACEAKVLAFEDMIKFEFGSVGCYDEWIL